MGIDISDHGMRQFISRYEDYNKLMAERNALPLKVLANEELLEVDEKEKQKTATGTQLQGSGAKVEAGPANGPA